MLCIKYLVGGDGATRDYHTLGTNTKEITQVCNLQPTRQYTCEIKITNYATMYYKCTCARNFFLENPICEFIHLPWRSSLYFSISIIVDMNF